ncbi:MAG: SdrD B-like domain-containing protein, partial [Bacteroidota bacterium]
MKKEVYIYQAISLSILVLLYLLSLPLNASSLGTELSEQEKQSLRDQNLACLGQRIYVLQDSEIFVGNSQEATMASSLDWVAILKEKFLEDKISDTRSAIDTPNQHFVSSSAPCLGNAGDIGGTVFQDAENDGAKVGNPGQSGVVVQAFDCAGDEVAGSPVTTDNNGEWTITGLTPNETYRVEFSLPTDNSLNYLQPSLEGTDNGTNVQFVTPMTSDCSVDYGLFDPSYCTTPAPSLIIPCYLNGDPLPVSNTAYDEPVLVKIDYSPAGDDGQNTYIAQSHEIGSVYGVAQHRRADKIFVGAVLRRHMGFGPSGSGAIYIMDEDGSNRSLFIDLNQAPISTGNITRDLSSGGTNPSRDADAFDGVGKTSLGDIDLSADEQTLWVMNLEERTLLEIPLGNDPENPTARKVPMVQPGSGQECSTTAL